MSGLPIAVAFAVGSWVAVPGGSWSPAPEQIADVRAQLAPYVKKVAAERKLKLPEWSSYSFQYQGKSESAAKVIFVNAFCIAPPPYTATQLVVVFDGGPCFFQATYDPNGKRFLQVIFNGEA